jgi:hypothetical protein
MDPKTRSFLSLILFPTWIVVNDINFGSDKVIQWVPRRHKVLTNRQERLFCKVTSVSIHSFVEWCQYSLTTLNVVQSKLPMSSRVKRSHLSFPVIKNFTWIEPLLRGYLSDKAAFSLFKWWPFNTGLTV